MDVPEIGLLQLHDRGQDLVQQRRQRSRRGEAHSELMQPGHGGEFVRELRLQGAEAFLRLLALGDVERHALEGDRAAVDEVGAPVRRDPSFRTVTDADHAIA